MRREFTRMMPPRVSQELISGDRMSREEFHDLYEKAPDDFKAELIGGVVYVAPPLQETAGTPHDWLSTLLCAYQLATPGVELFDNATLLLGEHSEPQPDLFLRVRPEFGGRSRNTPDGYVHGPPELVIEIAHSSKSIDLHYKRQDYHRCGVPEYLVYLEDMQQFRWFNLADSREYRLPDDGILRIKQFPGLWIDQVAMINQNQAKQLGVLKMGLAKPEHREFVQRLNQLPALQA